MKRAQAIPNFSLFICISFETSSRSSHFTFPDAAWTGSQGLPVPPLSRAPPRQPRPRATLSATPPPLRPPTRPPVPALPTPQPPGQAKPFPTCPRPRPRSATCPAAYLPTSNPPPTQTPAFSLSHLTCTNGQIEKRRKIKKQREKQEREKREREREREHEGVRASFFAAVDQSSYFLHFGVHFFWIAST